MHHLPAELLDEILGLAIALGTITPNEASRICRRWRSFQKPLFKTIKLDPLDESILDLDEHNHLTSYVEELRVVPRSNFPSPSYVRDLPRSFTKFLSNLQNLSSMIFCDSRIQWENVSSRSIDSFLSVFRRDSFHSLEVSVHNPLPSWMLLYGLGIASKLTIHYAGRIIVPLASTRLVPNQCSLTHLVLFSNAAVQHTAEFCLQLRNSAKVLLQKLSHLVLEYAETEVIFGPPMAPYVETLIIFLGAQLEVLDLRIHSSYLFADVPPCISISALKHLKSLQHISIRFSGDSTSVNTLVSATEYTCSFLDGIPSASPVVSLSLRIDERRLINPGAEDCLPRYHDLLCHISGKLASPKKWPRLTSASVLVDVRDNFTEPICFTATVKMGSRRPKIMSVLHVNVHKAGYFGGTAPFEGVNS